MSQLDRMLAAGIAPTPIDVLHSEAAWLDSVSHDQPLSEPKKMIADQAPPTIPPLPPNASLSE